MMPKDLKSTLAAVTAGEAGARQALFDRFYPRVQKIVHAQLQRDFRRNHPWILPLFSTGDIVQEVFVGVVDRQLGGFVGDDEDAFVQYLCGVVKHRLVDALRYHEASRRDARRQVDPVTQGGSSDIPPVEDATPSLAASFGEQLAVYREVLADMETKQRRILELRIEREEPFANIADILGIASADAARQAFRAAKARLLVRLRARGLQPPEDM